MSEQKTAHVSASVNTGMSVGGNEHPGRVRFHAKLTGLLLTVFLILAAGGGFVYWHVKNSSSNSTTNATVSLPSNATSPDQKAQYYADQGQYQQAEQAWQDQLASANTSQDKVAIYYQQAAVAIKFKQYGDTKKYANDIKQVAPNAPDSYVVLAQLATAQNNIPQAKQYWQQAISHIDPSSPGNTMTRSDYQNQLDALK